MSGQIERFTGAADQYIKNKTKLKLLEVDAKIYQAFSGELQYIEFYWSYFDGYPGTIAQYNFYFRKDSDAPSMVAIPIQMPVQTTKTVNIDGTPVIVDADPHTTAERFEDQFNSIDLAILATRAIFMRRIDSISIEK